jgi:co-chaperonin GroES (HSP10)
MTEHHTKHKFSSKLHYETNIDHIRPTKKNIMVVDMDFGERKTKAGIIIQDDDRQALGIRPRWAKVHAVGPEQTDVTPGEWILVDHGRWTRGLDMYDSEGKSVTIRMVDPKDIFMACDEKPADETFNTAAVRATRD